MGISSKKAWWYIGLCCETNGVESRDGNVRRKGLSNSTDRCNPFLYGFLDEKMYIMQPTMFGRVPLEYAFLERHYMAWSGHQGSGIKISWISSGYWIFKRQRPKMDHLSQLTSPHLSLLISMIYPCLVPMMTLALTMSCRIVETDSRWLIWVMFSRYLDMEVDVDLDKKNHYPSTVDLSQEDTWAIRHEWLQTSKNPIGPGVANSLTNYKNEAQKSIIAWYQSAAEVLMLCNGAMYRRSRSWSKINRQLRFHACRSRHQSLVQHCSQSAHYPCAKQEWRQSD